MCVSRLHRVLTGPDLGRLEVEDVDGAHHQVSLLAYDGPPPTPGAWVVVHSGYALGPAEAVEAEAVLAELRAGRNLQGSAPPRRPPTGPGPT